MIIKAKRLFLISTLLVLPTGTAFAERVTCKPLRGSSEELSYIVSDNPSRRLVGEIYLGADQFSGIQVAQYKTSRKELYLVLDDPETNSFPVLRLEANKYRKQQFLGKLTQYLGTVKISSKPVVCRIEQN